MNVNIGLWTIMVLKRLFSLSPANSIRRLYPIVIIYHRSLLFIDTHWIIKLITLGHKIIRNVRDIIPNFNVFVEIISRDLRSFNRVDEFNERFQLWNCPVQHTKSLKMQRNFNKNAEISSGI